MKKSKIRQMIFGTVMVIGLMGLSACGSTKDAKSSTQSVEQSAVSADSYDGAMSDTAASTTESKGSEGSKADVGLESGTGVVSDTSQISGQKLIKDVGMSVETKTFDEFMETIKGQVANLGGYVESSDVSGGSYQYENYRSGYIVARIPADKLVGFVNLVKEKGNVIRSNEQTTDVTLQYVDIESHLKALKIEQETLLGLLENATKMEDVIAIQSQLTQVRYEIESNESQIRTYDNLVNYSTVRIDVTEVERETQLETKSFGSEIKAKLSDNLYSIKEGFRSLIIELIAALPYFVILGVVLFIGIKVGKKIYRKYTNKRIIDTKKSDNQDTEKE